MNVYNSHALTFYKVEFKLYSQTIEDAKFRLYSREKADPIHEVRLFALLAFLFMCGDRRHDRAG
jgi:hypothetical protein